MRNSWQPPPDGKPATMSQETYGNEIQWTNWTANQQFVQNRNAQLFQTQPPDPRAHLSPQQPQTPYFPTPPVSSQYFPQPPSPNHQMPQPPINQAQNFSPGVSRPIYPLDPYDNVMHLLRETLAAVNTLKASQPSGLGLMTSSSPIQQQDASSSFSNQFNPPFIPPQSFPPGNPVHEDSKFIYIGGEAISKEANTAESFRILLLRKLRENQEKIAKQIGPIENAIVSLSKTFADMKNIHYQWERTNHFVMQFEQNQNLTGRDQTCPIPPGTLFSSDTMPAMDPKLQSHQARADDNNNQSTNDLVLSPVNNNQTCFGVDQAFVQSPVANAPIVRSKVNDTRRKAAKDTEDLRIMAINNVRRLVIDRTVGFSSPNSPSSSNAFDMQNVNREVDISPTPALVPSDNQVFVVQSPAEVSQLASNASMAGTSGLDKYNNVFESVPPSNEQIPKQLHSDFESSNLLSSNCPSSSSLPASQPSSSLSMPLVAESDNRFANQDVPVGNSNFPSSNSPSSSSHFVPRSVGPVDVLENASRSSDEASTSSIAEIPHETHEEKTARFKKIVIKEQFEYYLKKRKSITIKEINEGIVKRYPCTEEMIKIIKWNHESKTMIWLPRISYFLNHRIKFFSVKVAEHEEKSRLSILALYSCMVDFRANPEYQKCVEEDVWFHVTTKIPADQYFFRTTQLMIEYSWTNIRAYVSRQAIYRKFFNARQEAEMSDIEKEFMTAARNHIEEPELILYSQTPIFKERKTHYERSFGEVTRSTIMVLYYTVICDRFKMDEIRENIHVLNFDFLYLFNLHAVLSDELFAVKEFKYLDMFFN